MDGKKPVKEKRHYQSGNLPTFSDAATDEKRQAIGKILYSEVQENYRHLADIRFKLVGLVPSVSFASWIAIILHLSTENLALTIAGLIISILGLRIVFGIRTYDKRNDELYDDLISRGRKIEEEWGVETGIFRGRIKASTHDRFNKLVNHSRGLHFVYSSVFFGWGALIVWYSLNFFRLLVLLFFS